MDILKKYNKDAANENDSRVELFKSLDTDKIVYKNKYGVLTTLNNEPIIPQTTGLNGTSFVLVKGEGTAAENGVELQAAYDAAQLATPYGNPLSSTNRFTILVAPGNYYSTSIYGQFVINTNYVDIVSLSGLLDVYLSGTSVGATNVYLKGLSTRKATDIGGTTTAFNLAAYGVNQTFDTCGGGANSFGNYGTASGTFTNCVGGDESFGYQGIASGTFKNCEGGNNSFGSSGTASGTFTNCVGGDYSFGAQGTASGTFINCVGGSNAFGGFGVASGIFTNCVGGFVSFGYNGPASGTFTDCKGGYLAFGGGGTASGIFTNCVGDDLAFGGMGTLNGKLYYCRLTSGTFQTVSGGGITRYCLDGTNTANNQG